MATGKCDIPDCYRLRRREPDGYVHKYCGRTHAALGLQMGQIQSLKPPHGTCGTCKLSTCNAPVYFDPAEGIVYDFCAKRHARLARARGEWPMYHPRGNTKCSIMNCPQYVYRDPVTLVESQYCGRTHQQEGKFCQNPLCGESAWQTEGNNGRLIYLPFCSARCAVASNYGHLLEQNRCGLPGCVDLCLSNLETGNSQGFCSIRHFLLATQRGLEPVTEDKVDRVFRDANASPEASFRLMVLQKGHEAHKSVKAQFLSKWPQEKGPAPRVERIFKVLIPDHLYRAYKAYAQEKGHTLKRRFHGTSCSDSCDFFVKLQGQPCSRQDCNSCSIATHGFNMEKAGETAQRSGIHLRYGRGLYFSSVSGKSHDYGVRSMKVSHGRRWFVMFMANVVEGNAFTTKEGFIYTPLPPPGYDSVIGEVGQGLNYDELVVYNNAAAIPAYMIAYSMPVNA